MIGLPAVHSQLIVPGILLVPCSHCTEPEVLQRLWLHEVYRVFYDRLTDSEDRQAFFAMCQDVICTVFKKVTITREQVTPQIPQAGRAGITSSSHV